MALRAVTRPTRLGTCLSFLSDSRSFESSALLRPGQARSAKRVIRVHSCSLSSASVQRCDPSCRRHGLSPLMEDRADPKAPDEMQGTMQTTASGLTPWYLQTAEPPRISRHTSERQRLPDVPEAAPPIIQPLLNQLSVDLGLDYISILDLRKLDPPPALGDNLIMIFGSVRSEKHLYVAADRLCRWLRSSYKLRPDADGLIGRNELKLKLRRKARKAKLLGSIPDDNDDDGVRTGWVCVNVGVVESGKFGTGVVQQQRGDAVGFSRLTEGVRIVIQMLTEAKREEVNLESLWSDILQEKSLAKESAPVFDQECGGAEAVDSVCNFDSSTSFCSPDIRPSGDSKQSRSFSTLTRGIMRPQSMIQFSSPSSSEEPLDAERIWQRLRLALDSGFTCNLLEDVTRLRSHNRTELRSYVLTQMMRYLEESPRKVTMKHLGNGRPDDASSPYLTLFYQAMSPIPTYIDCMAKIWLYCHARSVGHEGYDAVGLLDVFDDALLCGDSISLSLYHALVRSILTPLQAAEEKVCIDGAVKIIQAMHEQGLNVFNEEMLLILQELSGTCANTDDKGVPVILEGTFGLQSYPLSPIQRRVHAVLSCIHIPPLGDDSIIRLMEIYAKGHHWSAFWDIWRGPLRRMKTHSALLYTYMFRKIAETQVIRACVQAIQMWVPDMERSRPAVELEGNVADAIQRCLLVIDPEVERKAVTDPNAKGNWLDLWRKCEVRHY